MTDHPLDLLPCPFCGNPEPVMRSNGIGDFYVVCESVDDLRSSCEASTSDRRCEDEVYAAERWNKRAAPETEAVKPTDDDTRDFKDIDLPYTSSSAQAQRAMKIALERQRREGRDMTKHRTMTTQRKRFIVGLDMPDDVSYAEMMEYIRDAVATWKGQLRPPSFDDLGDPLFNLDEESVKVMQYRKRRL